MHSMDDPTIALAKQLADEGEVDQLHQLIEPYIAKNDLFALYLYSGYSLVSFNESEEEFSQRNISLLTKASEGGISQASYQMGVNHLYGDDVDQSFREAKKYFERAIVQGHSYTKFTYGFSLYYGTDQNQKDEARGLALMNEAKDEGVELAKVEIDKLNQRNA